MLRRLPRSPTSPAAGPLARPLARPDLGERPRPFPTLDRAFDAVERVLARLGLEDPASLRTPRPVEEALSPTALPSGTLLVLDPVELRAAELDVEETVRDERMGGAVHVTLPQGPELETRKKALRELGAIVPTFAYTAERTFPAGLNRLRACELPEALRAYRVLLADTPGFRVAVIGRALPGGGSIGLWTGNEVAIDEVSAVLREAALDSGHDVPESAPAVPPLEGVGSERDVWDQAEELRAYRVIREAELREIARQAALKGVAMRREREAARRAQERAAERAASRAAG